MDNKIEDIDILSAFGLTVRQTELLFSFQKTCALMDAEATKSDGKREQKMAWIDRWSSIISDNSGQEKLSLVEQSDLVGEFKKELSETNAKTWFHLIILEAVTFKAYFPLGDKEEDKLYKKLSYEKQTEYIKNFISLVGYGKPEIAERYLNIYNKSIDKAIGKLKRIIMFVLLASAIIAAAAGAFAAPIAVFLVGGLFPGLKGAALVAACLAYLGGGAVAIGGMGMAGGVLVIVGGGALLGAAAGGAAAVGKEALFKSSPQFALTFAAKLNVVLREIILNEQRDVKFAQAILKKYEETIVQLSSQIAKLKLESEKDKDSIKNLKKSVEYMERIFEDMQKFSSSFEEGLTHGI